jgi:hypothetical protein
MADRLRDHSSGGRLPETFDLESLLALAESEPAPARIPTLVKVLMEITWPPALAAKLAQLDARLEALRALEVSTQALILAHPAVRSQPPGSGPPPAVAREFAVLCAAATAREKLEATRAALARRAHRSDPDGARRRE